MSLSKKPTTIRELKAALAGQPDAAKVEIYEGDDVIKMPANSVLRARKVTVIIL
jgi:hypothetical protein